MKAKAEALGSLARVVRESGLVSDRSSGVVLISGGPDSGCLAAGLAEHCGRPNVHALHLNYGLRGSAADDEQICRRLCASLRIDLRVERPRLEEGNMQAAAREARHVAAERLRERLGCAWGATGHTRTDVAGRVLYRLPPGPAGGRRLRRPARRRPAAS